MSDKFIGLGGLLEYNKQLMQTYIKSLENKIDHISKNYVTTDTVQTITAAKTFKIDIGSQQYISYEMSDVGIACSRFASDNAYISGCMLDPYEGAFMGMALWLSVDNTSEYGTLYSYDGISINLPDGDEYAVKFPKKSGTFALASDIPNTKSTLFSLCDDTAGTYIYGVVPNVIITGPAQLLDYLASNNIYDTTTSSMRFPVSGVSISGGHVYSVISICLGTSGGLVLKVGGNGNVIDTAIIPSSSSNYKWNFKPLKV